MLPIDATAAMPAPVFDQRPTPEAPQISLPDSFFRTQTPVGVSPEAGYIPPPGGAASVLPQPAPTAGIMGGPSTGAADFGIAVPPTDQLHLENVEQDPSSVIAEGRTPVELASTAVKRDRTTLRIVLLMVIGMILVAVAAALLILLG